MAPYFHQKNLTVYHGNSRDIVPLLPTFDLLLTDPPYGIGEARNNNVSRSNLAKSKDYGVAAWDDQPVDMSLLQMCIDHCSRAIVFGGNYFPLPPTSCWLVWDKDNGENDFADCELAWTNLPQAVRRIRHRWAGMLQEDMKHKEVRYHPTQKPVPVMKWCIEKSKMLDSPLTVLDPFMGSGTTLLAALELGISATGIEAEERYCEAFVKRFERSAFSSEGLF